MKDYKFNIDPHRHLFETKKLNGKEGTLICVDNADDSGDFSVEQVWFKCEGQMFLINEEVLKREILNKG